MSLPRLMRVEKFISKMSMVEKFTVKEFIIEKSGVEKSGFEMSCNCQTLLQEPRGYPCQNLNFIFPSQNKEAAFGYVIAEQNCIYPLFSGHNTICVVTALLVSLTLNDAGLGQNAPLVRRSPAISHRIMLWSQKFLTLSINIPTRR